MKSGIRAFLLALTLTAISLPHARAGDPAQDARNEDRDAIPTVFRDMGVVQKRAMAKGGRFLLSSYGSFDFSDGPYTNYSVSVNPGYALSDFWEVYLNIVPHYFVSARSIVDQVKQYQLADGSQVQIVAGQPQSAFGAELLWAPSYGKDSVGLRTVIRSDTFFKLGASQVTYDLGSGLRFVGGVGKTFFMGRSAGLRLCINMGMVQNVINDVKAFRGMALLETGLVLYL